MLLHCTLDARPCAIPVGSPGRQRKCAGANSPPQPPHLPREAADAARTRNARPYGGDGLRFCRKGSPAGQMTFRHNEAQAAVCCLRLN